MAKKAAKKGLSDLFGATKKRAKKVAQKEEKPEAASAAKVKPAPGTRVVLGVTIPPAPRDLVDPALGQRSPAVLEYYKTNHPEAYKALQAQYHKKNLG